MTPRTYAILIVLALIAAAYFLRPRDVARVVLREAAHEGVRELRQRIKR